MGINRSLRFVNRLVNHVGGIFRRFTVRDIAISVGHTLIEKRIPDSGDGYLIAFPWFWRYQPDQLVQVDDKPIVVIEWIRTIAGEKDVACFFVGHITGIFPDGPRRAGAEIFKNRVLQ